MKMISLLETNVLLEKWSGVGLASSFVQTQLFGHHNQNNERGIRRGATASAVCEWLLEEASVWKM